jgi:GNAT superfamily N-acetyltransferase
VAAPPVGTWSPVVDPVAWSSSRILAVTLPACRSAFRDLVARPVPPVVYDQLPEPAIERWVALHAARVDVAWTRPLRPEATRTWILATRPELGGVVSGWASVLGTELQCLYTMPGSRRRGIGHELLLRATRLTVGLHVPDNVSVERLVQHQAFNCEVEHGRIVVTRS